MIPGVITVIGKVSYLWSFWTWKSYCRSMGRRDAVSHPHASAAHCLKQCWRLQVKGVSRGNCPGDSPHLGAVTALLLALLFSTVRVFDSSVRGYQVPFSPVVVYVHTYICLQERGCKMGSSLRINKRHLHWAARESRGELQRDAAQLCTKSWRPQHSRRKKKNLSAEFLVTNRWHWGTGIIL